MDPFLQSVLVTLGEYIVVGILFFLLMNFMSKGVPWTIARARMAARSGGILVRVNSPWRSYFKIGKMDQDFLTYKNRAGKTLKSTVPKNGYRDFLGIRMVEVDEITNNFLTADFNVVPGHDAEKVNNLYVRLLTLAKNTTQRDLLLLIGVGLTILLSGYCAYKLGKIQELVQAMQAAPAVVKTVVPT